MVIGLWSLFFGLALALALATSTCAGACTSSMIQGHQVSGWPPTLGRTEEDEEEEEEEEEEEGGWEEGGRREWKEKTEPSPEG